jgi:hypothetical protein
MEVGAGQGRPGVEGHAQPGAEPGHLARERSGGVGGKRERGGVGARLDEVGDHRVDGGTQAAEDLRVDGGGGAAPAVSTGTVAVAAQRAMRAHRRQVRLMPAAYARGVGLATCKGRRVIPDSRKAARPRT